jgi:V/A-type H+-transporting ATPase subunit I
MIAKMRKVTALCAERDRDSLVQRLFDAGVVHVASLPTEAGAQELLDAKAALDRIEQAIAVLASVAAQAGAATLAAGAAQGADAAQVADRVRSLAALRVDLDRQMTSLALEESALAPFGDFDPELVRAMAQRGAVVGLYQYAKGQAPELPSGASLHELSTIGGMTAAAVISSSPLSLAIRSQPLPARSLRAVRGEIASLRSRSDDVLAQLRALTAESKRLVAARDLANERVEWLTARASLSAFGPVLLLSGFVPVASEASLRASFAREPFALLLSDPSPEDAVPTALEGPAWVRQVHTVFQGIGIVPGYSEPDVSQLFLLFLVLFAAMLIGDGGYGAIVVIGALLAWRKTSRSQNGVPQAVRLMLTIGVGTLVWGAVTGTWFAVFTPDNLPPVLEAMRIDWLAPRDSALAVKNIMLFCFVLGALHLTLAHGWAALRCGKTPQALAQLGWIGSTWLMFLLARSMVLGEEMPGFTAALAWVSIAAIALFMTPPKAIKAEWFNHVMLPLSLVSNFVDVVSYLRLFAVGSAGVAVAQSFNGMAANAAEGGGFGYVLAAFIALFGHTLNLMLAAMAVLVHGVRLNTLEFSAHLGLQWSGVPYRPFGRSAAKQSVDRANSQTNLVEE